MALPDKDSAAASLLPKALKKLNQKIISTCRLYLPQGKTPHAFCSARDPPAGSGPPPCTRDLVLTLLQVGTLACKTFLSQGLSK